MDKKIVKAINDQIRKEIYSGYMYLAMAAYLETQSLGGCAVWMKYQAKEEMEHAMKFFDFLNDRGEAVILQAIDKPPAQYTSLKDVFEKTLKHEQKVTASINSLYALAKKVNDNATVVFLNWFIDEQVEEEKNASEILGKLQYVGKGSGGLLMLDKALGMRGAKD